MKKYTVILVLKSEQYGDSYEDAVREAEGRVMDGGAPFDFLENTAEQRIAKLEAELQDAKR